MVSGRPVRRGPGHPEPERLTSSCRGWSWPGMRADAGPGRSSDARPTTSARRPSSPQVMHASSASCGSGSSRPGCSKQTWVSSQSRWYRNTNPPVAGAIGSWIVYPQHMVGRPRRPGAAPTRSRRMPHPRPEPAASDRRRPSSLAGRNRDEDVARPAPATRARWTRSDPVSANAGSARLPTITGWTNSTAMWCACGSHPGATHHSVAPRGEPPGHRQRGGRQVLGQTAVEHFRRDSARHGST